jgi:hypothetical protein
MADRSEARTVDAEYPGVTKEPGGSPGIAPVIELDKELWLDQFARYIGFGLVADRLSQRIPPSYVYAVTTVVTWTVVSVGTDLFILNVTPIYVMNPYFLFQPVVLLGGVYGAHSLRRSYHEAINEMAIAQRTSNTEQFLQIIPRWLPSVLFAAAAGLQLIRFGADFADFSTTGIVANGIIFPFVYAPILVQFLVIYVGIEFIAPWQLYRSDVGIHFLDPHGVGGLRPLGELVKKAYYYIVAGLIVYALITYAPGISNWDPSVTAGTIFTNVWLATIVTVAFPIFVLHRFLHREKRQKLQQLEAELRKHIENRWSVTEYRIPEENEGKVKQLRQRTKKVSSTREYPATFSIWTKLLLSIVTPKALQLILLTT